MEFAAKLKTSSIDVRDRLFFAGRVSMLPEASSKEFPPTRRWSEWTEPVLEWLVYFRSEIAVGRRLC
jgi:hypothetical protein